MNDKKFNTKNYKIIYMGTPDFAVPSLVGLYKSGYTISAVVTQPDKKVGRKQELQESAIKQQALIYNIPILQPERVKKNKEFIQTIVDLQPDLIIVAAYGNIIPQEILDIPTFGCLNIHGSILPAYRGASPIQMAIWHGDDETGVTIMRMDAGMDTGDIISISKIPIKNTDTSQKLHDKLSVLGAKELLEILPQYIQGQLKPYSQDSTFATYTKLITKEDGLIDWSYTARDIYNQYRACTPWPGVYTFLDGKRLKLLQIKPVDPLLDIATLKEGTMIQQGKRLFVVCGNETLIELIELQREGKKKMDVKDFVVGTNVNEKKLGQ